MSRPVLSFDGWGINGPDQYRSRLCSFTNQMHADQWGPLFEAAPMMLQALQTMETMLSRSGFGDRTDGLHDSADDALRMIRQAMAHARSRTYAGRVAQLELEGLTTSDAQGCADAEGLK